MLQIILQKFYHYYKSKNRWWIPFITGMLYPLCLPPFNHEFHWAFTFFPFLSLIVLIPLFVFSLQPNLRRALAHTFIYSFAAALGQFYWIGFDKAEGLWLLILLGLLLISAVIGTFYLISGMLFRLSYKYLSRWYILAFPALWVLVDYCRTLGDISFPWAFLGYSMAPILPFAQTASLSGVWGLTYIIVLGNVLFWEVVQATYIQSDRAQKWIHVSILVVCCVLLTVWGFHRIHKSLPRSDFKVSLLQTNLDQLRWGNNSLDTAFTITESMVYKAALEKPSLIIMPESALLCYLARRPDYSRRVFGWADSTKIPMLLGGLHWEIAPPKAQYDYYVYNTAFMVDPLSRDMRRYYKIKLVPFSEAMPFEANFPILSRVNLGEADFHQGTDATVFSEGTRLKAAPFICYEIVYPGFVRKRLHDRGANLMVNITNDGWFGKSTAPFQHAEMSRMRSIENGVTLARCANSGISMLVDPYGRITSHTGLYKREVVTGEIPLLTSSTFYSRHGDWFIGLCFLIAVLSGVYALVNGIRASLKAKH